MVELSANVLEGLRMRYHEKGERLGVLAAERGLTRQTLYRLLHQATGGRPQRSKQVSATSAAGRALVAKAGNAVPGFNRWIQSREGRAALAAKRAALTLTPSARSGPITERYRPATLEALVGQPAVRSYLSAFAAAPHPAVLMFEGETGTGKSSAALALALALGCDLKEQEFGGVHVIASGEQTADAVRETWRQMHLIPMYGSGWKVVIINEVDRMSPQAETVWLDRLEALPRQTVVIFTTNHAGKLSARFRDRTTRLKFVSDARRIVADVSALLSVIWQRETGRAAPAKAVKRVIAESVEDGQLSIRRAVQNLGLALATEGKGA